MGAHSQSMDSRNTLAERLNRLWSTVTWSDRNGRLREYSTPEVAKAITNDPSHDISVSRSYLAMLRNGSQTNPTVGVLEALAKFFDDRRPEGMPPITIGSLVGRDSSTDEDQTSQLHKQLMDHDVQAIAMRAGSMSPALRQQLLKLIDVLDTPTQDSEPS